MLNLAIFIFWVVGYAIAIIFPAGGPDWPAVGLLTAFCAGLMLGPLLQRLRIDWI